MIVDEEVMVMKQTIIAEALSSYIVLSWLLESSTLYHRQATGVSDIKLVCISKPPSILDHDP